MALCKRKNTWWTDFSVNGQRFRESLDTSDWREAQAKEKELIAQASQGKLAGRSMQFGRMAFTMAADLYLEEKLPHLASRTVQTEKERLKPLNAHFGAVSLNRISAEAVRGYVSERTAWRIIPTFAWQLSGQLSTRFRVGNQTGVMAQMTAQMNS